MLYICKKCVKELIEINLNNSDYNQFSVKKDFAYENLYLDMIKLFIGFKNMKIQSFII